MTALQQGLALDDLAQHLYRFLPGKPHPYGDKGLSFPGIAAELGLSGYWQGGSKLPAIRRLLEGVLNSGTGRFCPLLLKIVERGVTHRRRSDPVSRDEIERLNELVARLGFRIPELHDPEFLGRLPRQGKMEAAPLHTTDPQTLTALQNRLLKLISLKTQERGFAFEKFLSDLFAFHGLAPRGFFRLTGEQIDGSFQIGQEVYLLEAKWQDTPTAQADLLIFTGKVEGKATGALGLFVSYSGFSAEGLQAFSRGRRTSILCMDGLDLAQVLSGQLSFIEVIKQKRRRALETNIAFVPVRDLFHSVI